MNVLVDVNYLESDAAFRLRALLCNDCAELYPIRLWRWALMTERVNGRFVTDAKQLASIVKYEGDPLRLSQAFFECGVIETTGKENEVRICGWRLNAKLFKERERLRRTRLKQKRTRTRTDHVHDSSEPSSSSSSSYSLSSKEREREHALAPGINHPEVQFFEAAYREKFGGPPLTAFERAAAWDVIRRCAEARAKWQDVLSFYGSSFAFSGHTVTWLAKNLREVLNKRVAVPAEPKRLTVDEQRKAQQERMEREEHEALEKAGK